VARDVLHDRDGALDYERDSISTDPWRATFYTTGMEHSITSATASAWEPTPWHAVQGAAREALSKTAS